MISRDTSPEMEQMQIDLLRKAGPARRLQLAAQLSDMVWKASRHAVDRYYPQETTEQRDTRFLTEIYGKDLAERFVAFRQRKLGLTRERNPMSQEIYQVTIQVVNVLEGLGVAYEIGCSLASSVHGVPRSTLDADIVANLQPNHVAAFVQGLGDQFYADEQMIEKSVRARKSFNIIHLDTMLKLDIFALKDTAFSHVEFSRRVLAHFPDANGPLLWLSSPEDIILHKLMWYAEGGEVAMRQFQDVLGVLRMVGESLDKEYLAKWSVTLGVQPLLERALRESGKPNG